MVYIMGVDGGNSKTHAVIIDQSGKKLGTGVAGCGNHQVGLQTAITNIQAAMDEARMQAGLTIEEIDFVQYGLAGADRERDFQILRESLAEFRYQKWDIVCDTLEGLRTGTTDNVGVVLVCGSGTNAAGRNTEGEIIQTGGFGYTFGDGAGVGGHSLAVEAFRTSIRAYELREEQTELLKMVPNALGFSNVEQMFNHFLDNQLKEIPAHLSITLHHAAANNDRVAIRILEHCGKELGIAAVSVMKRLGLSESSIIPVVLVGSVIQKGQNPYLLNTLKKVIADYGFRPEFVVPKMAPVYGAVLLGMDLLGINSTEWAETKFSSYGGYENEKK